MQEPTTSNALQVLDPEAFRSMIATAPDVLEANRTSVMKAKDAGQAILDTIEGNGMSDDLDAIANEYQVKIRKTYDTLQDRRKPITQILDEVKKAFTSLEAEIDPKNPSSIFAKVQTYRNSYAQQKLEDQKKREQEAQRKLAVEKEKADIRSKVEINVSNQFNEFLTHKLNELSDLFSSATLEDIESRAQMIISYPEDYPPRHLADMKVIISAVLMTIEQVADIVAEVKRVKLEQFTQQYAFDIQSQKESLTMRIPARRNELQEIADREAAAEAARIAAAEAAKKAGAEEAKRLKEESDRQAAALAQQRAEAAAREEAERLRLAQEARQRDEKASREAEAVKTAANMQSLFDATENSAPETTSAKEAYEIEVTNKSAYLLLAQFWFEKEGMNCPVEDIEKKTFKQIRTFCEKWALKNEEKIKSPYIIYKEVAKATVKK